MLTEKDYCDYETCVALKEFGYVGICDAYYELTGSEDYNRDSFELLYTRDFIHPDDVDRVAAPLLYQAQKWLREEKNICVEMTCCAGGYVWELCKAYNNRTWVGGSTIYTKPNIDNPLLNDCGKYESYEDALLEGIKEAVKFLKEK